MNLKSYNEIVKKHSKKENIFKNVFVSFFIGGLMGVFGEVLFKLFRVKCLLSESASYMYVMITLVVISSILTGLGFFDKIVSFAKCGLIIQSTGFEHAMTSAVKYHKSEGQIKEI